MDTKTIDKPVFRDRLLTKVRFESLLERAAEAAENEGIPVPEARKLYAVGKGSHDVTKALETYLNTDENKARFNHYFVDGSELVYRTVSTNGGQARLREDTIAVKVNGNILGNSSVLPLIGRRVAFGRERSNNVETEIQRRLAECGVLMIPFSVFIEAGLEIQAFQLDASGPEETIQRQFDTGKRDKETGEPIMETRNVHFTGAKLFSVGESQFLFDVDRRELKHLIFNPFLVKLKTKVNTVAEAYDSLKPQAVRDAEAQGLKVERQGEWFFVPSNRGDRGENGCLQRAELRAGRNRPNTCRTALYLDASGNAIPRFDGDRWGPERKRHDKLIENASKVLVTGTIEHSGREHAPLQLKGFYEAVPNTATESWTIVGDVD